MIISDKLNICSLNCEGLKDLMQSKLKKIMNLLLLAKTNK